MDEITVHVTQEDIDRGIRSSSTACPIANAIIREHLDLAGVSVSAESLCVIFSGDDKIVSYSIPKEATDFVLCFDRGCREHAIPLKFTARRWSLC